MAIVTIRNTQKYTPTFCEPSVNPCYSRPLDGPHYCGRRPHRRLRRRHTVRRQGSGPRHGLARPARRRGDRRRGHGVAAPRSRGSDGPRRRRRGAAGGSDVVVQEDRLDAPRPRRRRDRRTPPGHPHAECRHLPRVPFRRPYRARPRAAGRRHRGGARRGLDPFRERPATRVDPACRGARGRRRARGTPGAPRGDDRRRRRRDGRRSRHDRRRRARARPRTAPRRFRRPGPAPGRASRPPRGVRDAEAERLGLHAGCATLPGGRWLIVAGRLHPATRRQIAAAGRAGLHVLATADAEHADGGDAAATLAREAASLLATESFDLIVLTGGDTAVAFYRTLGAARIDLVGAPGPGLALGYLRAPGYPALPVLTKAGGFGPPELFVSLRKEAMT